MPFDFLTGKDTVLPEDIALPTPKSSGAKFNFLTGGYETPPSVSDAAGSLSDRLSAPIIPEGFDLKKTYKPGTSPAEIAAKSVELEQQHATISQAPKEGFWKKVGHFFSAIPNAVFGGETPEESLQRQQARNAIVQSTTDSLNNEPYVDIAKQLGLDRAVEPELPAGVDPKTITPNVLQYYKEQAAAHAVQNNWDVIQKNFPDVTLPEKATPDQIDKMLGTDPSSPLGKVKAIAGILGTAALVIGTDGVGPILEGLSTEGLAATMPKIISLGKNIGIFTALDAGLTPLREKLVEEGNIGDGGQALLYVAQIAAEILGTHGVNKGVDKVIDQFAKHTVEGFTLPEKVTLSGEDIQKILRTNKMSTEEFNKMADDLGWGKAQRDAIKNGATVTTPSYKIITTADKPWWGKVKDFFGFEPTNETKIIKTGGGIDPLGGTLPEGGSIPKEDLASLAKRISTPMVPSSNPEFKSGLDSLATRFRQKPVTDLKISGPENAGPKTLEVFAAEARKAQSLDDFMNAIGNREFNSSLVDNLKRIAIEGGPEADLIFGDLGKIGTKKMLTDVEAEKIARGQIKNVLDNAVDFYNETHAIDTGGNSIENKNHGNTKLRTGATDIREGGQRAQSIGGSGGEGVEQGIYRDSVETSRRISEHYGKDGERAKLVARSAEDLRAGKTVKISEDTPVILRAMGMPEPLISTLQKSFDAGGVNSIAFGETMHGTPFLSAYTEATGTLHINPKELAHYGYQDGNIVNHEIAGHSWYNKLTTEGREAFYAELKKNAGTVRDAWSGSDNPHIGYWDRTLKEIRYAVTRRSSSAIAETIMQDFGLVLDEKMTLDAFVERSLGLDKTIGAINAELERRGYDTIDLSAAETTAVQEHVAMLAERAADIEGETAAIRNYLSDVQNETLKYGPKAENNLIYQGETDLTLKTLEKLKGRDTVSKQYISDLTNTGDLKQAERDVIRGVLSEYPDGAQIPVREFAEKAKSELLPLKRTTVGSDGKMIEDDAGLPMRDGSRYESISLPEEIRGNIRNYSEHIYESPIKTTAGSVHFTGSSDNYFGHTRVEDMAPGRYESANPVTGKRTGTIRRVIEVQSDLFQKGRMENEPSAIEQRIIDSLTADQKVELQNASKKSKDLREFLEAISLDTFKKIRGLNDGHLWDLAKRGFESNQEIFKLEPYRNTFWERMVREEIRQAAKDGKQFLQFPTGETAMKIEGLGEQRTWFNAENRTVKPEDLNVGETVYQMTHQSANNPWVITDVLGEGKFKAISKEWSYNSRMSDHDVEIANNFLEDKGSLADMSEEGRRIFDTATETFDISGKVDTNNPIYKFYEKEVGRYLKNKYDAKPITDENGVSWYQVDIKPSMATEPVTAFREKPERNPKFDSGDKMKDLRDTLAHVEKRVGTKSVDVTKLENMLRREEQSLAAHEQNPEAHIKAYGEDRKPKYEAKISELKERISAVKKADAAAIKKIHVSGKDIELPQSLVEREIALELKREYLQNHTLKPLIKYVATRGEFAGQLPEVTGEAGKSKFKEKGDQIIDSVIGYAETYDQAADVEEVRADMEKYLQERRDYAEEKESLAQDKAAFIRQAKDELALERLSETNAGKIEKEIGKVEAEKQAAAKARELEAKKDREEAEANAKKYGFTIPEYDEKSNLADVPDLIAYEDAIRRHPARAFMKYVNNRTGLLPEIIAENPGVYGSEMKALLEKKGYSSVADAQKAVDNYLAHVELLDRMGEDKFNPIELMESESVIPTVLYQTAKAAADVPGAKSVDVMANESDEIPIKNKVGILDFVRTPDRVLKKIGLAAEGELVKKKYDDYLKELPKNIEKIRAWAERTPRPGAAKRIFDYLDGMPGEEGFDKVQMIYQEELKVAEEMRAWLEEWARRLKLKPHEKLANYITHIFEEDFIKKEFDQDLAKIITNKVAGQVYDPFLEKRLGKMGYIRDAFRALDAYVKRATRKVHMDVALEQLKIASEKLDVDSWNYVKQYVDRVNLRPTQTDNYIDNSIKQLLGLKIFGGNPYRLGARPLARVSRAARQMVYRGTLGLNIGSALKNLTQGSNTFAMLGPKYTTIGYTKLFNGLNHQELYDENILNNDIIQDRTLSSTKKFWENTDKVLFYLFETAEKINRGAAYFGAKAKYYADNSRIELTKDGGKLQVWNAGSSEAKARAYAKKIVEQTQFTFGSVDTPVALQSDIAKTLAQFQSFNVKQAEFLAELAKTRNYAGMLRFVLATIIFSITLGKLFGMKWKDAIPFSRYSLPPLIRGPLEITKALIGAPDQFGNVPSKRTRLKSIIQSAIPFVPGGVQAQKIYKGIKSSSLSDNPVEIGRSILFGRIKESDSDKVVASISKSSAAAKTKLSAIEDSVRDPAESAWEQVKKVGVGTEEADAIVSELSDAEYTAYKEVKTADADYWIKLAEKVAPTVKEADKAGFGSEAADEIVDKLTDEEYAAYQKVKSSLYGKPSEDLGSSKWEQQTFMQHVENMAKGWGTSPITAFDNLIHGDWKITQLKNGQIIVNRMPLDASEAIKKAAAKANSKYKLDHIVPLEVGGTNRASNLQIIPTEEWETNSPVENYLGSALADGKITGRKAREYIVRFKASQNQTLSSDLQKEYEKRYGSKPLTFDEIKTLVGE